MALHGFQSVAAIPVGFWRWPHISPEKEWVCKGSGTLLVDEDFLDLFEQLRTQFGRSIPISSGYRSPAHNAAVSTTGRDGPHTTGRAFDAAIYGAHAYALIALAIPLGFTGIGIKGTGPHASRFIHLDLIVADPTIPRPALWSY